MTRWRAPDAEDTVLVLVRHGQSAGNAEGRFGGHGPTELSRVGHAQARRVGAALARELEPTRVVASDLPRAAQTARAIAGATGAPLALDPALRERGLGCLDGLTFAEAEREHPELMRRLVARDPSLCPPGGETVAEVFSRVSAAVDRIVRGGGRVVAVSHALAIHHAIAHILGMRSPAETMDVIVHVDNASTSTFVRRRGRWRVTSINDRRHAGDE